MDALAEFAPAVARRPRPSAGFVAAAALAPETPLKAWAAFKAGMRNPLQLWDRELFSLRYREIRRFGRRMLELTDPELMHAVLVKEREAFVRSEFQLRFTRPLVGGGLLTAKGEHWRRQRSAASPCFRAKALELMVPAISRAGERAVRALRRGGRRLDVMPAMMTATFDVIAELLSPAARPILDQPAFDAAAESYLQGLAAPVLLDMFGLGGVYRCWPTRYSRAIRVMRRQIAAMARGCPGDREDLLSRLATAYEGRGADELHDSLVAFMAAGNETAALGLTWALYLIANDAIVQQRLADESCAVLGKGPLTPEAIDALTLHANVIKEALRLYPPIALMMRTALRDVRIGDVDLKRGDEVVCATYVMHRSPLYWDNPAVLDPDRFSAARPASSGRPAFLPFGAGHHVCIGMPLANMELTGLLALLTRSFCFRPGAPAQPVMQLTLRPLGGMPLCVTRRA